MASITDLPPMSRLRVAQYPVWVRRCLRCGRRVRGQHPDLALGQYGATAHWVGQRVMATAHTLHYQLGIPVRKVPAVLENLTGLQLTQGPSPRACPELAEGMPCVGPEVKWALPTSSFAAQYGNPRWPALMILAGG